MVSTILDHKESNRVLVASGSPRGNISVTVDRLLAAILLVSVLTVIACSASASPPPEVTEVEIYIVAKDKSSGDVVDETKYSDVRKSGSCEDLAEESAVLNPNLEFHCETRRQAGAAISADEENTAASTEPTYLVQYNLENGQYSVELTSGGMARCEQMAAELGQATLETTALCQKEVQANDYERYGAVLLRVGEQYFVGGIHDDETRGKLITEDDIKTVIEHAKCMWETPELISQLYWTDDQDEDDTVRRHLNLVPFIDNLVRDFRLTVKQFC